MISTTADFDVASPDQFAAGHPFALYDELRRTQPVYRNADDASGRPVWALFRHADVEAVSRNNADFTSTGGNRILERDGGFINLDPEILQALGNTIIRMDPPAHAIARKPLQAHFTAPSMRRIERRVATMITDLITSLPAQTEIDFVTDVAAVIPVRALCIFLGIPDSDWPKVFDWTNRMVGASDAEYNPTASESNAAYAEVFDYGDHLFAQRRQQPRGDILDAMLHLYPGDDIDSTRLRRGLFTMMLAAGNETTRNSLTGSIIALTDFSDQRRLLAEGGVRIHKAVAELLRFVSPVYQMMRTARTNTMIGDQAVAAGDRVAFIYGAANNDPTVFTEPRRLQLDRANSNQSLAFGIGVHRCLGAPLALMELTALLQAICTHFPEIEAVSEPQYMRSNFLGAIKHLRVNTGPKH